MTPNETPKPVNSKENYLTTLADEIRVRVGESNVPPGDADSLFRTYAVLALAKGAEVSAEDVHNAWVAWVSATEPGHEAAVPFDQLDSATREQDEPFLTAIREAVSDA